MPDEDEGFLDDLGELTEDAIAVETFMGWDGDACECTECECPRFRDGGEDARCPECRVGEHWGAGV